VVDEKGRGWRTARPCLIVHLLVEVDPQFGSTCQGFLDRCRGLCSYLGADATADLWSVLGRSIFDTPWFRLLSDGAIWPAQIPFLDLNQTGSQALLKPVSQVTNPAGGTGQSPVSSYAI
jgi:hypothetical protein